MSAFQRVRLRHHHLYHHHHHSVFCQGLTVTGPTRSGAVAHMDPPTVQQSTCLWKRIPTNTDSPPLTYSKSTDPQIKEHQECNNELAAAAAQLHLCLKTAMTRNRDISVPFPAGSWSPMAWKGKQPLDPAPLPLQVHGLGGCSLLWLGRWWEIPGK